MSNNLIIVGYSGHAYVVIDSAISAGFHLKGYLNPEIAIRNPYYLDYLGTEANIDLTSIGDDVCFFSAIGSNIIRKRVIEVVERNSWRTTNIFHSKSIVSPKAEFESSILIAQGAIVNSLALVRKGTIINSGAIVEHNCEIDQFCHIAPGAVLTGNIKIGSNSFVGAGAVIRQNLIIGNNVIVGAGAVVIHNIPNDQTWAGNPAKRIK